MKTNVLFYLFALTLTISSCNTIFKSKKETVSEQLLSKEEQQNLTPDEVILGLKEGNEAFVKERLTYKNTPQHTYESSYGQYPEAIILSCIDSRVPVESIFNKAVGDIFVARIAGNVINEDITGSLEYSCKVSGSKVVVVLGHQFCGAVESSIKGVKLGNITSVLEKIEPAIEKAKENFDGETVYSNPEFVDEVCHHNVLNSIKEIRENSSILAEMEGLGQIKIIGATFNLKTGKVNFIGE